MGRLIRRPVAIAAGPDRLSHRAHVLIITCTSCRAINRSNVSEKGGAIACTNVSKLKPVTIPSNLLFQHRAEQRADNRRITFDIHTKETLNMCTRSSAFRLFTLFVVVAAALGFAAGRIFPATQPVSAAGANLPPAQGEGHHSNNNAGLMAAEATPVAPDTVPPTTPGTLYKTYSGTCFTPHGTESAASQYAGGGGIYRTSTSGSSEFDCLLELPQGARVTEVIYYVRDNSANTINLWFATYRPDIGAYANITSTDTTGVNSSAIVQRGFSGSSLTVIDNTAFQYLLEVGLNETTSNHTIYGARVGYVASTTFLPQVLKNGH
jgi:hypothetical protein